MPESSRYVKFLPYGRSFWVKFDTHFTHKRKIQVSNEKNPGCLGYVGDYTTQLNRDYNKPI